MMGPQSHTPRYTDDDKNLIAEQPGRMVLFSGILLAVILGLIVRGLTAPNKVKSMIESAASRIHKDIDVSFDGAQISLSNGLLPRFAVIISNVKMESENECWMKPRLLADEIRLPLSLWALVDGASPITRIEGGHVQVDLRSPYKNCESMDATPEGEAPKIKQFVVLKQSPSLSRSEQPSPQVQAIVIDRLQVSAPGINEPVDLRSFAIYLKSNSPRVVEITAKTYLMKDDLVGDYLSHATVWGEYSEFPRARFQGRISGNWREGSYNLKGSYDIKQEELSTELDLKHIPLSQVSQILKKFQWIKEDLKTRQVWVSLNAQGDLRRSNFKNAQVQVRDLRLEGDLGDLSVAEARITSLDPLKYSPVTVDIRRFSFEKFLALQNQPHPSNMLGQLGSFTGTAEIKDENNIQIRGVQSGLEFIFSNKGQREVQTITEMQGEISLERDRWQAQLTKIVPAGGAFDGQLRLSADRHFKNIELKTKANEIRLAPNVVRLMTAGGKSGAFSGDLHLNLKESKLSNIKGVLNAESLEVEGVEIQKARMVLDEVQGEIVSQTQMQRLSMAVGSPAFAIMKEIIEPDWMSDQRFQLRNLSTQLRIKNPKVLSWKNFSAQLEKGGRLNAEGQWDEDGFLSGLVQAQSSKGIQKWNVGGKRDMPVFTVLENAKKKKQ